MKDSKCDSNWVHVMSERYLKRTMCVIASPIVAVGEGRKVEDVDDGGVGNALDEVDMRIEVKSFGGGKASFEHGGGVHRNTSRNRSGASSCIGTRGKLLRGESGRPDVETFSAALACFSSKQQPV